ncbi:hypothetical protein B0A48_00463 [Cryoendolithus antarcticus]|uniref:Uncharacterized protein n=1 Tax=Cryoendolithus antarcticus TaxID=1507870 RepID=A0A1V8TUX3_9PEZI|nr:hypothetical protein B0A48_00463 [Cryoendolithus antarcticus]
MDAPCEPVAFAPMVAALNFPWNNLVKLSTAVHSGNLCCTDAWADAWSPLQNWLASLRSLQTLAINFEVQETNLDWYDDILYDVGKWNRLAACLGHAPLFSLMLGVGHMPYAGLILLLESLKTRLRHLIISNARLLDYESNDDLIWPRAFQCIADSLRLEHLEFHEFSHEDDSHMATLDDTSPFVANGTPKSVRASLEHFIATVKFEYDGAGPQRDDAPWHAPAKAETEACTSVPHTDVDNEHEVYSEYGDEDDYGASFDDFDVQAIDFLVSQRCDDRYAQGSETEREGTN